MLIEPFVLAAVVLACDCESQVEFTLGNKKHARNVHLCTSVIGLHGGISLMFPANKFKVL